MPSTTRRKRPGEVRDAIVGFLTENREPASVAQIVEAVSLEFGGDCSPSSVRSYLNLNEGSVFQRVARGQYALPGTLSPIERGVSSPFPSFAYGKATMFEADCFHWLAAQPPETIHAVVTDPPYGLVEYSHVEQSKLRAGRGGVWRIPPSFDGHQRSPVPRFTTLTSNDIRALEVFFLQWGRELLRVVVPGAHVIVASNPLLSYAVSRAIVDSGFERRGEIVRLVMTMRGGDRPKNAHNEFPDVTVMPRSMWEPWLVFRKPLEGRVQDNLRRWGTGALRRKSPEQPFGDVIASHPTQPAERKIAPHPSLKPQAFLRQIVRASLPLGRGVVLDPFAGSGSTLAAAEALGCASMGVEKDPAYVAIALEAIPSLAKLRV
jgi:site-specific DNA-methyltransferase (adenine-specific)